MNRPLLSRTTTFTRPLAVPLRSAETPFSTLSTTTGTITPDTPSKSVLAARSLLRATSSRTLLHHLRHQASLVSSSQAPAPPPMPSAPPTSAMYAKSTASEVLALSQAATPISWSTSVVRMLPLLPPIPVSPVSRRALALVPFRLLEVRKAGD